MDLSLGEFVGLATLILGLCFGVSWVNLHDQLTRNKKLRKYFFGSAVGLVVSWVLFAYIVSSNYFHPPPWYIMWLGIILIILSGVVSLIVLIGSVIALILQARRERHQVSR